MTYVRPIYKAHCVEGTTLEIIWQNVCKEIVKKKFPNKITDERKLTVLFFIAIILKAHGLKCSDIENAAIPSILNNIRPHVEPTIRNYVNDPQFQFKNRPRTLLIFAYLAYYSPQHPSQ